MQYRKLSFLLLFSFIAISLSGQGIKFFDGDWKDALALAKKEDKLLFVDAFAKWCGPCKQMAKHEFTKAEVGDFYNTNFINLKLDMEEMDGVSFGHKYPVKAFPTMFFLDGDGKVVKKVKGGKKGNVLIKMGQSVLSSYDRSGRYVEAYEKGDRSYDLVYDYVKSLNQAGKPSLLISNQYISSKPDISEDQLNRFLAIASVESDSKIFDMVVKRKKAIQKLLGEEEYEALINKACMATVEKSVEFESDFLLDEAKSQASKALDKSATEKFELNADLHYATAYGNESLILKTAEEYAKKYGKKDLEVYRQMIKSVAVCKDKNKVEKFQLEFGEKLYKKSKAENDILLYCGILIQAREYDKAIKIAEKAIKDTGDISKDIRSFQRVIQVAKAGKA